MKIDGERKPDNPSDQNIEKTQRFYGAATIDGVPYRVKSTAIVSRNTDRTRMHNYEITKIELLSPIASTRQKAYTAVDNNSITLAKLLKNVEFSYEKGRKLLDEIENNGYGNAVESASIKELWKRYRMGEAARTYSEGEQRDMADAGEDIMLRRGGTAKEHTAEEKSRMQQEADNLGTRLGGENITFENNGHSGIKGWYDSRDGSVHVNLDEADGIDDVKATVCHEKLGHEGKGINKRLIISTTNSKDLTIFQTNCECLPEVSYKTVIFSVIGACEIAKIAEQSAGSKKSHISD